MKCHQRILKEERLEEDLKNLPFNPNEIPLSEYVFTKEDSISKEVTAFIYTYEWLRSIGVSPKFGTFTVRLRGYLAGVLLVNEPAAYSKLLGPDTPKMECLIQRGTTVSWAHPHLGSKLIMFGVSWMVQNTEKRVFVGYADALAGEVGILYQATNFKYLGTGWGATEKFKNPNYRNGKEFCKHSLRRTSVLKGWCKQNGIKTEKSWFKKNGFKDLSQIPEDIKKAWYLWGTNLAKESEKIKIPSKGKYILVKGKTRKEQKYLDSLCTFKTFPYPKRT